MIKLGAIHSFIPLESFYLGTLNDIDYIDWEIQMIAGSLLKQ